MKQHINRCWCGARRAAWMPTCGGHFQYWRRYGRMYPNYPRPEGSYGAFRDVSAGRPVQGEQTIARGNEMKITCSQCGRRCHPLGFASHRAAHYRERQRVNALADKIAARWKHTQKHVTRNFIYTRVRLPGGDSLFRAYNRAGVMVESVRMRAEVVDDLFGALSAWKRPGTDDDGTCVDIPPKRGRR